MAQANPPQGRDPHQQRVQVRIGGEEFWLKGDAPRAHLERLAVRVDAVLQSVLAHDPSMPRYRAAILAAIHLAHELEARDAEAEVAAAVPGGRRAGSVDGQRSLSDPAGEVGPAGGEGGGA
ncbi:cell division protein ZapA [Limnochorda pilosa]|uniref:Cell division protein ZapA n=1 Tax=Limnochorda pilosa TaxID=1555112 RepID=A0A0K2SMU9_LIMPI|nr:cell division protein ZapA [Limnochorda pilosa]BAS28332.1 hypothetical protein LIP_2496 [Limnochorda pilosa]